MSSAGTTITGTAMARWSARAAGLDTAGKVGPAGPVGLAGSAPASKAVRVAVARVKVRVPFRRPLPVDSL
ncbi:hypothetical protein JCM12141A_21280 [Mycolicibacterium hodleri]